LSKDARHRANRRGRGAETFAAMLLRLKGYRILARGYRVPAGEIDIIARRGNVIAFVEVKARGTITDALDAVGAQQRARIARAAEHYIATNDGLLNHDLRFDVIAVVPKRLPTHMADAWRL
jgi:putative endonuclease